MQFAHAVPEDQLGVTRYDRMRRGELMKLAIHRNIISPDVATPPKHALIKLLESGVSLVGKTDQIAELSKPESVPLNEAHLAKTSATVSKDLEIEALKQKIAELEGTPESKLADFKSFRIMKKRSILQKECGIEMPKTSKSHECNARYAEYLGINETN